MADKEQSTRLRQIAGRFEEDFIWPRYGALGGPDTDECEQIVRAVLAAQEQVDGRREQAV